MKGTTDTMPDDPLQAFLASMVLNLQAHMDQKFEAVHSRMDKMATKEDVAEVNRKVERLEALKFSALGLAAVALIGALWAIVVKKLNL